MFSLILTINHYFYLDTVRSFLLVFCLVNEGTFSSVCPGFRLDGMNSAWTQLDLESIRAAFDGA